MIITYGIRFFLHKERSGKMMARVKVMVHGIKPVEFSLGFSVEPLHWDDTRQCVARSHPIAHELNRRISECSTLVRDMIARYEHVEKRLPSEDEIKAALRDAFGKRKAQHQSKDSFNAVFREFIADNDVRNQWTYSTLQKFNTLSEHVNGYRANFGINEIDDDFMTGFVSYLINTKNLRNTSAFKMVKFLRWVLRWAAAKGIYTGNAHTTYKTRLKGANYEQKEVIYLSKDELKRMESYTFERNQGALERVRDVFVFCCYTGLRYSDVAKLKTTDIHDGYISVVTRKTNDLLKIELNAHSKAILQRYESKHFPDNLALPVISNQKSNEYLKEIGVLCKIDEPVRIVYYKGNERIEEVHPKHDLLTTHVARRTFVVTALQLGIPAEVIIRWTGHRDYEAMKPYIAIVDELKARNMSKFDTL